MKEVFDRGLQNGVAVQAPSDPILWLYKKTLQWGHASQLLSDLVYHPIRQPCRCKNFLNQHFGQFVRRLKPRHPCLIGPTVLKQSPR